VRAVESGATHWAEVLLIDLDNQGEVLRCALEQFDVKDATPDKPSPGSATTTPNSTRGACTHTLAVTTYASAWPSGP